MYLNAADMTDTALKTYPELFKGVDIGEVISATEAIGLFAAILGVANIPAAGLVFMRRMWWIAAILCLLSAVMGIIYLFGPIIGIVAFWLLRKAKPIFA